MKRIDPDHGLNGECQGAPSRHPMFRGSIPQLINAGQQHRQFQVMDAGRNDYEPIKRMQLQKFDGTTWKLFGEVISGSGG